MPFPYVFQDTISKAFSWCILAHTGKKNGYCYSHFIDEEEMPPNDRWPAKIPKGSWWLRLDLNPGLLTRMPNVLSSPATAVPIWASISQNFFKVLHDTLNC